MERDEGRRGDRPAARHTFTASTNPARVCPLSRIASTLVVDRFDRAGHERAAGRGETRQQIAALQQMLDLDRDVVADAGVRAVQRLDQTHGMRRAVEEIGIAERMCPAPAATCASMSASTTSAGRPGTARRRPGPSGSGGTVLAAPARFRVADDPPLPSASGSGHSCRAAAARAIGLQETQPARSTAAGPARASAVRDHRRARVSNSPPKTRRRRGAQQLLVTAAYRPYAQTRASGRAPHRVRRAASQAGCGVHRQVEPDMSAPRPPAHRAASTDVSAQSTIAPAARSQAAGDASPNG